MGSLKSTAKINKDSPVECWTGSGGSSMVWMGSEVGPVFWIQACFRPRDGELNV